MRLLFGCLLVLGVFVSVFAIWVARGGFGVLIGLLLPGLLVINFTFGLLVDVVILLRKPLGCVVCCLG